jgi:hypothetical protein
VPFIMLRWKGEAKPAKPQLAVATPAK